MKAELKDSDRIPTRQESIDACYEAFEDLMDVISRAREEFKWVHSVLAKDSLREVDPMLDKVIMLIGGCE